MLLHKEFESNLSWETIFYSSYVCILLPCAFLGLLLSTNPANKSGAMQWKYLLSLSDPNCLFASPFPDN